MTILVGGAILGAGVIGAGATIFASSQQQKSQQAAINQQQQSQSQAIAALQQGQQLGTSAIQQYQQPFINYATGQQGNLSSENQLLTQLLTPGANQTQLLSQLPGFQFSEDLAKWGIQAGAGRSGFSGTTAYQGGSLASQIAQQGWQNLVNPLQQLYGQNIGLYGTGAGAAGQAAGATASLYGGTAGNVANVATQTGGNISSLLAAQGQTQAGGITGAAGGIGNALTLNALISGLKNQNAGAVNPQAPIQYPGPFQTAYDPANAQ